MRDPEEVAREVEARGIDVRDPTVRAEVFAQAYVHHLDSKEAAAVAGLSPFSPDAGTNYKQKPIVKARILELMDDRAIRTQITADKVLSELALIGFSNVKDFFTWDGSGWTLNLKPSEEIPDEVAAAIKEIWKDETGRVRVKFYDKLQALDKIARHLGMFTQRVEIEARITGRVDVANGLNRISDDELLRLRELAEKMALPERSEVIDGEPTRKKET
jgi:phage terminase small subunit